MTDLSEAASQFFAPLIAQIAEFSSETRLYDLETPLGKNALVVESFVGKDALSTLYEYHVTCLSTNSHIELKILLGQQAILRTSLPDGTQAARSGYISATAQLGADGGLARYRITLVPWLALAMYQRRSRVYQDIDVLGIVEDVLCAYAPRNNWRATPDAKALLAQVRARSYCCQYRESDYAFLSRLLAEEGIGFYIEEADAGDNSPSRQRLVLFADSTAFPEDDSAARHNGIRFHRDAGVEQQDGIQALGSERRLQAATTTVSSWDYKAKRVVAASLATAHDFGGTNAPRIESNDWAGVYAFATQDEAEHYARTLREAADAQFKTWFGRSNVRTLRAGAAFKLTESPLDHITGGTHRFAVLGVLHAGVNNLPSGLKQSVLHRLGTLSASDVTRPLSHQRDALRSNFAQHCTDPDAKAEGASSHLDTSAWDGLLEKAQATGYANRFTAIRADVPWRPALIDGYGTRLNPKPTAYGSQTAIVVGADGSAADAGAVHTDHLGRIRIRYHWQRDESNTCWVRAAQMFAGPGYGAQFIPRIGQEVVVKFLNNDIDRPLVIGVLYNGHGQDDSLAYAQAGDHAAAAQDNQIGNGASPAWHGDAAGHRHAGFLSGFKSVALGADGYTRQSNQLVFDDSTQRLRTKLSTDSAATQLNLGHLIHQSDNYRGSLRGTGWELCTDAHGALRAGKGLLMTTYYGSTPDGQPEPAGENSPGIALLKQTKGFAETFSRAAATHQTVQFILVKGHALNGEKSQSRIDEKLTPIDAMLKAISGLVGAQDGSTEGPGMKIPHMHEPLVVVTAQAGIGVAATGGMHVAAGEVVHFASGRDMQIAGGEALSVHSGQAIGLLAGAVGAGDGNAGIKLYAGQGDVELQAQSDEMALAAKELLRLVSANSHVDFAAAKSITLCTEGGASLTIEGGNIAFACPGTISIKSSSKSFGGPARINRYLPEMPASDSLHTRKFVLQGLDGKPIEGASVALFDPEEKTKKWSNELANGHSLPIPPREGPDRYVAVMGFKESVFHFYDMQEQVSEEIEDEIFEDEHHDREGE